MEIRKIVAYSGPNLWAHVPVLEATIDLGNWKSLTTDALPDFASRLASWLDSLDEPLEIAKLQGRSHIPASENDAKFVEQLRLGTSIASALTHVIAVLETIAGTPPEFTAHVDRAEPGLIKVAFQYEEEAVARACLQTAVQLTQAALDGDDFDAISEKRKLVDLADDARLGPSTRAITHAATQRGIPFRRLNDGSLVQLGEGKFQRRIWTAETDSTSAIAEAIAQDKDLTKAFLSAVGVPVPRGRAVTSPADAWAAALEIGLPVAVKPRDANHGRGISLDLTSQQAVEEAFDFALREGDRGVMVEKYARGCAHRLLVIGDRLVAAARGQREYVIGDGQRTIAQLADEVNQDPLRGDNYTNPLELLKFNDIVLLELKKQGLTPESIPAANRRVLCRRNGDLTTDCTSEVHPDVAEKAVLAAQVVGLDIAGLDVIAEDIGRPFEEQGGVIVEVNAGPGLSHHVAPLIGEPQPVGEAIVDMIFPPGSKARMPMIAVTGSRDRAEVIARTELLLSQTIPAVSSASTLGIFHRGKRIATNNASDAANILALLLHPKAEAAVFESHPDQASAKGLGCERCDVAIVTRVDDEATLLGAIATVRAVPPGGTAVLPADSEFLPRLIAACRGTALLFSGDGETEVIREHRNNGGLAAFVADHQLVLAVGSSADVIEVQSGRAVFENLETITLPSAAATWAAGFSLATLRSDVADAQKPAALVTSR